MKTMSDFKAKDYDAVFEEYKGKKRFKVLHPDHKRGIVVAAPNEQAAIVAAARAWDTKWQRYTFYAYCCVTPM